MSYNPNNPNGQATSANSAPVVPASDWVGNFTTNRPLIASTSIIRPANTTAYAAGQILSSATSGLTAFPTFALGIGNSKDFVISNASIISSNGGAATKGQFAVYLFNAASPSGGGFNDAASFVPTAAALSASGLNSLVGVIPSLLPNTGTASYGYMMANNSFSGQTDSSGNVYLAVVLANAYTPASGEVIYVSISGNY